MSNKITKLKSGFSILAGIIMVFGLFAGTLAPAKTAHAGPIALSCNSATIEGDVQTSGVRTEAWFEWGKFSNVTNNSTPHQVFYADSNFQATIGPLLENTMYSYRAMASNQFGQATGQTLTFTTPPCQQSNPPTVSISADQTSLPFNGSTTVRWSSSNATSCNASGGANGWAGSKNLSGSFFTGNLTSTTTYSITCSNSSGSASDSTTVSVGQQVQNPTVTITADQTSLPFNGSTTVRWSSTNASSCNGTSGANGWAGGKSIPSGSFFTGNLTGTTTYSINCSNSSGSASDSVTIFVSNQPPQTCQDPNATNFGGPLPCQYQQVQNPTVQITADQNSLPFNGSTTVRWSSSNATSCSASGGTNGWAGSKNLSGSFFTGNLTSTVTYNITCSNSSRSANDSVTVSVGGQIQNPTVQIFANPSSVAFNGTSTITWTPNNATSCTGTGGTNGWAGSRSPVGGSFFTGNLTSTTTYSITCSNSSGSASDSVTVFVNGQVQNNPTVTLTADNTSITSGGSTILRWNSNNADSCTSSGGTNGWAGSRNLSGSFNTGALTSTRTYNITCSNNSGSANDSVTVNVNNSNGNAPTVDIRADDRNISSGDRTIVRWTSENADSCRGTGGTNGWSGSKNLSGSFNTGDLDNTVTYRIVCTNEFGTAEDSVTVNVEDNNNNQRPTVNIFANPATVNSGGASTITWNSNNADSCQANGGINGWSGSRSLSGSFFTGALSNSVTFSITCTNQNGTAFDSTSVSVINNPVNNQPTVVVFADSTNLPFNGATTVRWSTTNATSCFASGGSVGWAGTKSIGPGSFFTGSLTSSRTYTMTCSNDVGSSNDSVTVNVRGQVLGTSTTVAPTSLVLVTSSVDRNRPIVPTLDNTNPCPGDEINYTITYQNIGTASITNLVLRVDLPLEVDYMFSNPSNPVRSGQTLLFNLGTLRANGQGTVTVHVRVRDNVPAGAALNFPAVLSYIDPSGFPQQVTANVSANVCGLKSGVALGANVFGAGFLPSSIFGWLLLLILILILILLAKHLFGQSFQRRTITTVDHPLVGKKTTTTIQE